MTTYTMLVIAAACAAAPQRAPIELDSRRGQTIVDSGPWRAQLSRHTAPTVTEKKVMVPMSDGVRLAADIVRPSAAGRFPVILIRTPYGRESEAMAKAPVFAPCGYVVVAEDVRGCFASEGEWFPIVHETEDGYDTLDWLVAQPWCDGNIGMIGGSYVGWVQWFAAKSGHPSLKAIIPQVSPPDPDQNIPYEGGTLLLATLWWGVTVQGIHGNTLKALPTLDNKQLATLPLGRLDDVMDVKNPFVDIWLAHPPDDGEYWDDCRVSPYYASIDVPALHLSGWFDGDQPGAMIHYPGMRHGAKTAAARDAQYLIMGPWGHAFNTTRKLGERDFGPEALLDLDAVFLRFFDRYLKGVDNGIDREPHVATFCMGKDRWSRDPDWPLPQTEFTRLYLNSDGHALKMTGDGRLQLAAEPRGAAARDEFVYDPIAAADVGYPFQVMRNAAPLIDQSHDDRADFLDYLSPPLAGEVEITGPVAAVLSVSTDAADTDFVAQVYALDAKGSTELLASGIQRLRYRDGKDAPVPPGTIVAVTIDCWATSQSVAAGSRLLVRVGSSAFPAYARNLNTLEPMATAVKPVVAHNRVHHDQQHQSFIVLPVIPRADTARLAFAPSAH
ncbi:MAG: CocE/NonD family hydrolase [Planctomycetota bacterium]